MSLPLPPGRLQEDLRTQRRSVADAVDCVRHAFGEDIPVRGRVHIGPLRLASGHAVGLVDIEFSELGCIVSLPTAAQFSAIRATDRKHFDIWMLDEATVDGDATVRLTDGILLRSVAVEPFRMPHHPSDLDRRILWHVINLTGNEARCYRDARSDLPEHLRAQLLPLPMLDVSTVQGLDVPPLKVIAYYLAQHDKTLKKLSQQKIADALRMFGVRVPLARPRISNRRASAENLPQSHLDRDC